MYKRNINNLFYKQSYIENKIQGLISRLKCTKQGVLERGSKKYNVITVLLYQLITIKLWIQFLSILKEPPTLQSPKLIC